MSCAQANYIAGDARPYGSAARSLAATAALALALATTSHPGVGASAGCSDRPASMPRTAGRTTTSRRRIAERRTLASATTARVSVAAATAARTAPALAASTSSLARLRPLRHRLDVAGRSVRGRSLEVTSNSSMSAAARAYGRRARGRRAPRGSRVVRTRRRAGARSSRGTDRSSTGRSTTADPGGDPPDAARAFVPRFAPFEPPASAADGRQPVVRLVRATISRGQSTMEDIR
jgi:hypothetical protein